MVGLQIPLFVYLATWATLVLSLGASPSMEGMEESMALQREQLERLRGFLGPDPSNIHEKRQTPTASFANARAREFFVDGKKIPLVNFDAGPSWAGLLPISGARNETRKLFFW